MLDEYQTINALPVATLRNAYDGTSAHRGIQIKGYDLVRFDEVPA